MALLRPCLGLPGKPCGKPAVGSRCKDHHTAWRQSRGYNSTDYQQRRAAILLAEPWCHANPCRYPDSAGTDTNPLTADHVDPTQRDGPLVPMCMRDNAAKRDRFVG